MKAAEDVDPDAFREARAEERSTIDRLVRDAKAILESAGHAASDATLNRVTTNLRTGAVTEEGRPLLKRGRLADDLGSAGFDAFAGMTLPSPRPPQRGKTKQAAAARPAADGQRESARERRLAAARAELERAREDAARLEREAAAAEDAAAEAERALERAEREAKRLRAGAERAAGRLAKAEQAVARAE